MSLVLSGGQARRVNSSTYHALRESVVDIQRQIEDLGWLRIGQDPREAGIDDDPKYRIDTLKRIRIVRRKNPLAKQAVKLLQHYVIGQGVSLRANNKAKVARLVDEFWDNPVNQATFTSHQSMQEFLDYVYTDGEVGLLLYPDTDNGTLEIGMLRSHEIEEVIPDPKNRKIARWYKVQDRPRHFDFRSNQWVNDTAAGDGWVYYRDWQNDVDSGPQPPKTKQRDGLLMLVTINKHGLRGESELAAALDWIVAHRNFMQDRSTLNKAAAQFAWRKKRKGPGADVQQQIAALRSTLTVSGRGYESNPPPSTGSTLVENEATTTDWIKTDTGGAAADFDERKLRMMAGSGMGGIPNHYFGDEASANLATATAMELPLLKTYEDWQEHLRNTITNLVDFMLHVAHEAGRIGDRDDSSKYADRMTTPQKAIAADNALGETALTEAGIGANPGVGIPPANIAAITAIPKQTPPAVAADIVDKTGTIDWYVDVDFPPIVKKDIGPYITSLKALYEMLPGSNIESQKLVVEMALNVLGQNDIDELMERLFPPDLALPPPQQPGTPDLASALSGLLGHQSSTVPVPTAGPAGAAAKAGQPAAAGALAESAATQLAEYRVRRLLRLVSDTRDALAVADH